MENKILLSCDCNNRAPIDHSLGQNKNNRKCFLDRNMRLVDVQKLAPDRLDVCFSMFPSPWLEEIVKIDILKSP